MSDQRAPPAPADLIDERPIRRRARNANGVRAAEPRAIPGGGDTTLAETRRGRLEYFVNDGPIGQALAEYGEWAEAEIGVLLAFVERGGTAVDVGANVGTHSLAFADRVGPLGSVLSFEPQGPVCRALERNMAANGCGQVQTFQAGVGAAAGTMRVPDVDYGARANLGAVALQPVELGGGERVPILSLDGLEMQACDLIKIDAEGMGPEVLAGAADTLGRLRPVVAIECNSVDEGVGLWQARSWTGYRTWLLRAVAFNPRNFRRNPVNFFGPAHESTLIFVPDERARELPPCPDGAQILPVHDLDTLAAALLATPRYGDATAIDRDPDQLRQALALSEDARRAVEADSRAAVAAADDRHRALAEDLSAARDASEREIQRLEFRAASLLKQLRAAEDRWDRLCAEHDAQQEAYAAVATGLEQQLAARDGEIAAREFQVAALRRSTSWRVTAPLRGLKRLLTPGRE